ncbi:MAG: amino acid permease [Archaeoglobaceae archaeon]
MAGFRTIKFSTGSSALEGWGPQAFTVISVIALFATMNTVLITSISTSRILYGVSKDEYHFLPAVFSKVHGRTRTPHIAVLSVCVLAIVFTLPGDIGAVAGLANPFLLIVFVLVNASLLKLRYKYPDFDRGFRAPLSLGNLSVTTAAGFVTCLALIVFYLTQNFI